MEEEDLETVVGQLREAMKAEKCQDCRFFYEVVFYTQETVEEFGSVEAEAAVEEMEEWLAESRKMKTHKRLNCTPCLPDDLSRKYSI